MNRPLLPPTIFIFFSGSHKLSCLTTLLQHSLSLKSYFLLVGTQPQPYVTVQYIKNWKVQHKMFCISMLFFELAISQCPFAGGICIQEHSVESQPRCFTASSPSNMRSLVGLVTVIIYSAKSVLTNSRYPFAASR